MSSLRLNVPRLLLLLLLPGLYLADVLYGAFSFLGLEPGLSPGTLIRGLAFLACFAALCHYASSRTAKPVLYLLLLVALTLPGIAVSVSANPSLATLGYELRAASKTLFGPTMAVFFCFIILRWRLGWDQVLRYIEYTFYLLGVGLFLMQALRIGLPTYGDYASGMKGIFGPQNDISLALGLSMIAAIYRNLLAPSWRRLPLLVLAAFGFVGLGTRTSLLLTAAIPVCVLFAALTANRAYISRRLRFNLLFLVGPLLVLVFSAAVLVTVDEISRYRYQVDKYAMLVEGEHPRAALIEAGRQHLAGRDVLAVLGGEGADSYRYGLFQHWDGQARSPRRIAEVDWLDLYGQYGILFVAAVYLPLVLLVLLSAMRWLWARHPVDALAATGLLVFTVHSVLAGHALSSPIPSSLAAAYAALFLCLGRLQPAGASESRDNATSPA